MRKQLTDAVVKKLAAPSSGRLECYDVLLPWLALRVTSNNARSFVVRGRIRGQNRPIRYTLGDARLLTLAQAREMGRDVLIQMRKGIDPREEKRAQQTAVERRKAIQFEAVAEKYIQEHVSKLRSATRIEADIRRYLLPEFAGRAIDSIMMDDVAGLIRTVGERFPAMASKLLNSTVKPLFAWASSPGRPRAERLEKNPVDGLTAKHFGFDAAPRDRALSNAELRLMWHCVQQLDEPHRTFYTLLMLTGQRRNEIARLSWSEIDFNERVIILPAERMKAQRPHEVPLTGQMMDLLQAMPRQAGPFIFSQTDGKAPIGDHDRSKKKLDALIAELGDIPTWRIHDIRRAVRTGLGAIPQVPHDVAELVVAHIPPALTRTYNLHGYRDEKRQALELWGQRLRGIVEPTENNVVNLGARR